MTSTKNNLLLFLTPLLLLAATAPSNAASNGVRDDAHFFSPAAISQAQQTIDQIERRHSKDVLVETLPTVPDEQKAQLEQAGQDQQKRESVFSQWADSRFRSQGVNGIYILITKNPAHLEVALGNNTRQDHLFSRSDRDTVRNELLNAFKQKNYDQGLTSAVQTISQRMDANAPARGSGTGTVNQSAPPSPTYTPPSFPRQQRGWGFGSIACILIAVVLFIILIRGIFGRSGGNYYGGGGYQQGGYQQGGYPQGGYPPGGGYGYGGGGGGGGFGRGFLGGLLGGAVGGYAADRWMHGGQQTGGGNVPPATGGDFGGGGGAADTGSESSGGDFGGTADAGGGGGGDWGGGGGGDFGGGGGGDFGGGGDSGGSSGGDF